MKLLQKTMASLALASFAMVQPIAAQAAAAKAIPARAASSVDSEELAGSGSSVFVILGVFVGLLLLAELTGLIDVFGNDDDLPTSP